MNSRWVAKSAHSGTHAESERDIHQPSIPSENPRTIISSKPISTLSSTLSHCLKLPCHTTDSLVNHYRPTIPKEGRHPNSRASNGRHRITRSTSSQSDFKQLSQRVEQLALSYRESACKSSFSQCNLTNCHQSSFELSSTTKLDNCDQITADAVPCFCNSNPTTTPSRTSPPAPWYRHCRPNAPLPRRRSPILPDSRQLDPSPPCLANGSSDQENVESHASMPPRNRLLPVGTLPGLLSAVRSHLNSSSSSADDLDFLMPSPPPSNLFDERPTPMTDSIPPSIHSSRPLASIVNVLPNSGHFADRIPRWSHRTASLNHQPSTTSVPNVTPDYDSSSTSPPLPPPPPLITDDHFDHYTSTELPSPPPPYLIEDPAALNPTPSTNVNQLTRPIGVKRGVPDGAEEEPSSDPEPVSLFYSSKRGLKTPSPLLQCSPKKSRNCCLIPSEFSAFLPVNSHYCSSSFTKTAK